MTVKLLTEHHLEFLRLKGGCTGSSESTKSQIATLLEITCHGSYVYLLLFKLFTRSIQSKYAQSDQSLCLSLEYSMTVKLLTEHHLEFLSLKGGCTGSSESTHVKLPHCWKSHVTAQLCLPVIV